MSNLNPFRRKQMQILGLDNASYTSAKHSISSSESGSSTVSHFSDRGSAASIRSSQSVRSSNSMRKVRVISPDTSSLEDKSDDDDGRRESEASHRSENDSGFTFSAYADRSPDDEGNPFDEEEESDGDDFFDEFDEVPSALRRRRTVPDKANSTLDLNSDNPWRTSTVMGNHPHHKKTTRDGPSVPLKAQKMLGIAKRGRIQSEDDYRRTHSLSPQTENVAPKAQRMLGIPSNPFQKPQPFDDRKVFGDELERHGSIGPQNMGRKPMDVDEFKRLLLSGEMDPHDHQANFHRGSSSNTDISSLSRGSLLSSQADSHIETPRTSHEYQSRHNATRIVSDSPVDPASNLNEPYMDRPYSAVEMDDPTANKPLPPTPRHSFGTPAASSHDRQHATPPRGSSKGQTCVARADIPAFIAELPASEPQAIIAELPATEAIIYEMEAPYAPAPGSEASPVELPAREASPIEPSYLAKSLNAVLSGPPSLKIAPALPPPRKGGSNRNSMVESPPPQLTSLPSRSMSTRLDRSIANPLSPHPISTSEPTSIFNLQYLDKKAPASFDQTPPPNKAIPPPPPVRRGAISPTDTEPAIVFHATAPTKALPTPTSSSSAQLRLPPLQTSVPIDKAAPQSALTYDSSPLTDYVVSAVRDSIHHTFSPAGSVSTINSPLSPARGRTGLGAIAKAAIVGQKSLSVEPRKKRREWSWEPGASEKIDTPIDSRRGNFEEQIAAKDESGGTIREESEERFDADILADLGVLQEEVDALMGQYERPRQDSDVLDCDSTPSTTVQTKGEVLGEEMGRGLSWQKKESREQSVERRYEESLARRKLETPAAGSGSLVEGDKAQKETEKGVDEGIVSPHGDGTPF